MKRVLNVLIIMALAVTLACAPKSRRQSVQKTGTGTDVSAKPSPAQNPDPSSSTTGQGVTPQNPATPPNLADPAANPPADPAAKPVSDDNTVKTVVLGDLTISHIQVKVESNDVLALEISAKDGDKDKLFVASVDKSKEVMGTEGITEGSFTCADGSTVSPIDCLNSTLNFTLNGLKLKAIVTQESSLDVEERIEVPVTTGDKTEYKKDSSIPESQSSKLKVATAEVRRVILALADKKDGDTQITGIRAKIIFVGATDKTNPDDVLISKDSNSAIEVFGIPTLDLAGQAIQLLATAKKENGHITPRVEDYKSLLYSERRNPTLSVVRYSVSITDSSGNNGRLLVLLSQMKTPNDGTAVTPLAPLTVDPNQGSGANSGGQGASGSGTGSGNVGTNGAGSGGGAGNGNVDGTLPPKANIFENPRDLTDEEKALASQANPHEANPNTDDPNFVPKADPLTANQPADDSITSRIKNFYSDWVNRISN